MNRPEKRMAPFRIQIGLGTPFSRSGDHFFDQPNDCRAGGLGNTAGYDDHGSGGNSKVLIKIL
jgi:hypothetical protein